MRLQLTSTEAKNAVCRLHDRWLTQMKTQVRENTMDGYRYAFEKHIAVFHRTRNNACHGTADGFQDFVNLKFDQGASPTPRSSSPFHHAQVPEIRVACRLSRRIRRIMSCRPSDALRTGVRPDADQHFLRGAAVTGRGSVCAGVATYGLRRSECAGLRWCAVDFRARSMVINHTAVLSSARIYADSVKTKPLSTPPLSDLAPAVSGPIAPQTERQPQKSI